MRALAATIVVFQHIDILFLGGFGVDIFFVISGFVIAYVARFDSPNRFFLKRIFRVVPLYWLGTLAVFLLALVAPALLQHTTANLADLIRSLLFIPFVKGGGIAQPILFLGWTLNYEMLFYALFGLGLALWRRNPAIPVTVAICSLVLVGMALKPQSEPFRFWTDPVMLEFLFGVWLFKARSSGFEINWPPALSAAVIALLLAVMTWGDLQGLLDDNWIGLRALTFGPPALAIVALGLSTENKWRVPAALIAVGDASYSLYLLHPYVVVPAQKIIVHFTASPYVMIMAVPLLVGVAILLAIVCYRTIEKPSNLWLRRKFLPAAASEA